MKNKDEDILKYVGMTIVAILFVCCCCCISILAISQIFKEDKRCSGCEVDISIDKAVSETLNENIEVKFIRYIKESEYFTLEIEVQNDGDFFVIPGERMYLQSGVKKFYPVRADVSQDFIDLKTDILAKGMNKTGVLSFDINKEQHKKLQLIIVDKSSSIKQIINLDDY